MGHRGHAIFGQKLLNTQHSVGSYTCNSPIMKWANTLKESSKKISLKPNTASHNNASWCTDTDRLPEHPPSGGSLHCKGPALQKIILVFRGIPSYISVAHVLAQTCSLFLALCFRPHIVSPLNTEATSHHLSASLSVCHSGCPQHHQ